MNSTLLAAARAGALVAAASLTAFAASAQTCGAPAVEIDRALARADAPNVGAVVVSVPVDRQYGGRSAALQHAEALRSQLVARGIDPHRIYIEDRGSATPTGEVQCAALAQR